ncbi:MAG: hypothetical protein AAGD13_15325 [Pseudomonadota bacterium]
MGVLDLRNALFNARVCSDANRDGHPVADVSFLNIARILWVERDADDQVLRFQLDADNWLTLDFSDAEGFARVDASCANLLVGASG